MGRPKSSGTQTDNYFILDWPDDQTDLAKGSEAHAHLWEESWDDDDTNDDFAKMLKEELKRVGESQQNGKK